MDSKSPIRRSRSRSSGGRLSRAGAAARRIRPFVDECEPRLLLDGSGFRVGDDWINSFNHPLPDLTNTKLTYKLGNLVFASPEAWTPTSDGQGVVFGQGPDDWTLIGLDIPGQKLRPQLVARGQVTVTPDPKQADPFGWSNGLYIVRNDTSSGSNVLGAYQLLLGPGSMSADSLAGPPGSLNSGSSAPLTSSLPLGMIADTSGSGLNAGFTPSTISLGYETQIDRSLLTFEGTQGVSYKGASFRFGIGGSLGANGKALTIDETGSMALVDETNNTDKVTVTVGFGGDEQFGIQSIDDTYGFSMVTTTVPHGLNVGDAFTFDGLVDPKNVENDVTYYVWSVNSDKTFEFSTKPDYVPLMGATADAGGNVVIAGKFKAGGFALTGDARVTFAFAGGTPGALPNPGDGWDIQISGQLQGEFAAGDVLKGSFQVLLGSSDGSVPGIEIKRDGTGPVTIPNWAFYVDGDFQIGKSNAFGGVDPFIDLHVSNLAAANTFDPLTHIGTLKIDGAVSLAVAGWNTQFTAKLGDGSTHDGLVLVQDQYGAYKVSTLWANLTVTRDNPTKPADNVTLVDGIKLHDFTLTFQGSFEPDGTLNEIDVTGNIALAVGDQTPGPGGGWSSGVSLVGVQLSQGGVIVTKDGLQFPDVTDVRLEATGNFQIGPLQITAQNLMMRYHSEGNKNPNNYFLIGGTVTLPQLKGVSVTLGDGGDGDGLKVFTTTGHWELDGFKLVIPAIVAGPVELDDVTLGFSETNAQNWSLLVGGTIVILKEGSFEGTRIAVKLDLGEQNGNFIVQGFAVDLRGLDPGIPILDTGGFITDIGLDAENLNKSNFSIDAVIGASFGENIQVAGNSYSLVQVTAEGKFTPGDIDITGSMLLAGGLASGSAQLDANYAIGRYQLDVDLRFYADFLDGHLRALVTPGKVDALATLSLNVPNFVPIIGGYNLGQVGAALELTTERPTIKSIQGGQVLTAPQYLRVGDPFKFTYLTAPSPASFDTTQIYYVTSVNPSGTSFSFSTTPGGASVTSLSATGGQINPGPQVIAGWAKFLFWEIGIEYDFLAGQYKVLGSDAIQQLIDNAPSGVTQQRFSYTSTYTPPDPTSTSFDQQSSSASTGTFQFSVSPGDNTSLFATVGSTSLPVWSPSSADGSYVDVGGVRFSYSQKLSQGGTVLIQMSPVPNSSTFDPYQALPLTPVTFTLTSQSQQPARENDPNDPTAGWHTKFTTPPPQVRSIQALPPPTDALGRPLGNIDPNSVTLQFQYRTTDPTNTLFNLFYDFDQTGADGRRFLTVRASDLTNVTRPDAQGWQSANVTFDLTGLPDFPVYPYVVATDGVHSPTTPLYVSRALLPQPRLIAQIDVDTTAAVPILSGNDLPNWLISQKRQLQSTILTIGPMSGNDPTSLVSTQQPHGFAIGQAFVFQQLLGASSGLSNGVTYYVSSIPSATTFTFSTAPSQPPVSGQTANGGSTFTDAPSALPLSISSVTLNSPTDSSSVVTTTTTHGLAVGQAFVFQSLSGASSGLSTGVTYYVTSVLTPTTFTFSTALNGSNVTGQTAGTGDMTVQVSAVTLLTDANGHANFYRLPYYQWYQVKIWPKSPGYIPDPNSLMQVGPDGSTTIYLYLTEDDKNQVFTYEKTGFIQGQVFRDLGATGTRTLADPPISGVTVYLDDNNNGKLDPGEQHVATSSDGSFDFLYNFPSSSPYATTVRYIMPAGLVQSGATSFPVTISQGNPWSVSNNFVLIHPIALSGVVYADANGNGRQDPGEAGLPGIKVTIGGAGSASLTTDAQGYWAATFNGSGVYQVSATIPTGGTLTGPPTPYSVDTTQRTSFGGLNFGLLGIAPPSGSGLAGVVFSDLNGNGVHDPGEPGLSGYTVDLTGVVGRQVMDTGTLTSPGQFHFDPAADFTFLRALLPGNASGSNVSGGPTQFVPVTDLGSIGMSPGASVDIKAGSLQGDPSLVDVAVFTGDKIVLRLAHADGSSTVSTLATGLTAGSTPGSNVLLLADLNGDHLTDLIAAAHGGIVVFLSDGFGRFEAPVPVMASNFVGQDTLLAIDRSTTPPTFYTASTSASGTNVYSFTWASGAGIPTTPSLVMNSPALLDLAVGDFNGDGRSDLVRFTQTNTLAINLGPTFTTQFVSAAAPAPLSRIAVSKLFGDAYGVVTYVGRVDANRATAVVSGLLNGAVPVQSSAPFASSGGMMTAMPVSLRSNGSLVQDVLIGDGNGLTLFTNPSAQFGANFALLQGTRFGSSQTISPTAGSSSGTPPTTVAATAPTGFAPSIPFVVNPGTIGAQSGFPGSLGLDFDTNAPILVSRLGVFDSGGDGLNSTLTAMLYDRDNPSTPLAVLTFSPGDQGVLIGGSRFKNLAAPLRLPAGFHGRMVASGFNSSDPNGNVNMQPRTWSLDTNNNVLTLSGASWNGDPGAYPTNPDTNDCYAAGTFQYVQMVTIDTDTLSVTGDGDSNPHALFGQAFTARMDSGVADFIFPGDVNIPGAGIVVTGKAPARIVVGGNLNVSSGTVFDVSAINQTAGPGGGAGAGSVAGGSGGAGGGGGGAGGGGGGGGGSGNGTTNGGGGYNGNAGGQGNPGTGGSSGAPGAQGSAGFNNNGGGGGGNPGTNGPNGQATTNSGVGGYGGGGAWGWGAHNTGYTGGTAPASPNGQDGQIGNPGFSGQGGTNNVNDATLSGGSGGGSGGGGGGGGAGGGGPGGGGGGGGGGGVGSDATVPNLTGGYGGYGGAGGDGGAGGNGGTGGTSGAGGAGAGALQILAYGRVVIVQAVFNAQGGDGQAGGAAPNNASGGQGGGGQAYGPQAGGQGQVAYDIFHDRYQAPNGGDGGPGAVGGNGGSGKNGGAGGAGGGGAGGTVWIAGSVLDVDGLTVNAQGGAGGDASPGAAGGNGRFLYGSNTSVDNAQSWSVVGSTRQLGGPMVANPLVKGSPLVPTIPGLDGGAYAYGFVKISPPAYLPWQPTSPTAALIRTHLAMGGYDFQGYDQIMIANLSPWTIFLPRIGAGEAGYVSAPLVGGVANDPAWGGSGPYAVGSIAPGYAYVFMVPSDTQYFNLQGTVANPPTPDYGAETVQLLNGQAMYLAQTPASVGMVAADLDLDGQSDVLSLGTDGSLTTWHNVTGGQLITNASASAPSGGNDIAVHIAGSETGFVSGTVFNDMNDNGKWDQQSDPGLGVGVLVYVDLNNNNQLDPGEPSETPSEQGYYSIGSLPYADKTGAPIAYHVRLQLGANGVSNGMTMTYRAQAADFSFNTLGATVAGADFGVYISPDSSDFDQDGNNDVVLTDRSTGGVYVQFRNQEGRLWTSSLGTLPGPNWRVGAVGRFNEDAVPDVLLVNDQTGEMRVWSIIGGARPRVARTDRLAIDVPKGATLAAARDLNRDGSLDLFFQNTTTGHVDVTFLDRMDPIGTGSLPDEDVQGALVDVALLDSDLNPDLLWRRDDGTLVATLLGPSGIKFADRVLGQLPSGWTPAGALNVLGDGSAEILIQDLDSGAARVWSLGDGGELVSQAQYDLGANILGISLLGARDQVVPDVYAARPLLVVGTRISAVAGVSFTGVVANLSDPDPTGTVGRYVATIDWGDGTPTSLGTVVVAANGGFQVMGTHTYAAAGWYTATIAAVDTTRGPEGRLGTATSAALAQSPKVGPTVLAVAPETPRDGKSSGIVVSFDRALDASRATLTTNYVVTAYVMGPRGGTRLVTVTVAAANYDASNNNVSLTLSRPIVTTRPFRIRIRTTNPRGVVDAEGHRMTNAKGKPADFIKTIKPASTATVVRAGAIHPRGIARAAAKVARVR